LTEAELDAANERLVQLVNESGEIFLSATRLRGRLTVRVAIGHIRTTEAHVQRVWHLLLQSSSQLNPTG
jgi:aromatic-L-amino-acid decarboxylase